jgi:hypothetical protein
MKPVGIGSRWIVAGILIATAARAAGAEPPTIEDVKKAWTARQEANKTFRAEWTESVMVKAGSRNEFASDLPGPHPPKDTELKVTRSFAGDGEKAECVENEWAYWPQKKEFRPYKETARFDGVATLSFEPDPKPGWQQMRIETDKERAAGWVHHVPNKPLRFVYRPLGDRVLDGGLEDYKLSGRTERLGGVRCVEIVRKDAAKYGGVDSLWCDPAREFLPIRASQRVENAGEDTDWEYRKDDRERWVPTGWHYTQFRGKGGKDYVVEYTTKAELKKLELGLTFAADTFSTRPPPRSLVTVVKARETQEEYLVRADGSKRPLAATERFKNLDEVAKTNADGTPYAPTKK